MTDSPYHLFETFMEIDDMYRPGDVPPARVIVAGLPYELVAGKYVPEGW